MTLGQRDETYLERAPHHTATSTLGMDRVQPAASLRFICGVAVVACLMAAVPQNGWSQWDAYQPTRLDTLLTAMEQSIDRGARSNIDADAFDMWIAARTPGMRIRARYIGETRSIQPTSRYMLRSWLRSAGLDSNYVDLYSPSVRFGTTAGDLWLPVQSKPLEYMQDESSKCDHLELYAVYHRRLCHRARPDPMDDSCERIPAAVTHSGTGPRPARRRLSR